MNATEIKVHVEYKKPGTAKKTSTETWDVGASGDVTLKQLAEMAMAHFGVALLNKTPRIMLQYQKREWAFPDYYKLSRIAGFANSHDLTMKLNV